MRIPLAVLVASAIPTTAFAEPTDDGYCDHVEGVAEAETSLMFAPSMFGQFGRIEQAAAQPTADPGTLRLIGGMRFRISGIYEGVATRARAKADCRRHTALEQIRGETLYRAFEARAKVIDDALHEADTLLVQSTADLDAHRTTAQDATATRLRVEELRRVASETHRTMSTLPRPSTGDVGLVAFQQADAEVERRDAQLRGAKAIDVSMRVGVDQFLDGSSAASPYFAVLAVDLNLGLLFQGSGNRRAAEGRLRYLRSGRDPLSGDLTADRLRVLLDTSIRRDQETAALEADLARDLENLDKASGEESRRYRQVVWFEWIKVRAERAFHQAHAAALRRALGV